MWEDTLREDLHWSVSKLDHGCGKSVTWRAPSWPWASVDGKIEYRHVPCYRTKHKMMYKIIAASCQRAGIDSTGEVSSGYLVFGGLILPCTIRCESDRYAMTFCGMSASFNSSYNLCTGDLHCHEDGSSFSCLLLAVARDRQYHTGSKCSK
jgi:hypothetical protein